MSRGHLDRRRVPVERFRSDAGVLDGVDVIGGGSVADALWARPVATVLAIEGPAVKEVTAVGAGGGPGGGEPSRARRHRRGRRAAAAGGAAHRRRALERPDHGRAQDLGAPVRGTDRRPRIRRARRRDGAGVRPADGAAAGQGGAIPLCVALSEAHPDAEILLIGVEEPACRIHAPDESVSPDELRRTAVAEALLLRALGA